jgi:hypothetical protein
MKLRQNNSILRSWGGVITLLCIWIFAFILSSPLFRYNKIHTLVLDIHQLEGMVHIGADQDITTEILSNNNELSNLNISSLINLVRMDGPISSRELEDEETRKTYIIYHCVENWPWQSRLIYSYTSLLLQYTVPILIVGIAYGSIWCKLNKQRKRLKSHHNISMMRQTEEMDTMYNCKANSNNDLKSKSSKPTFWN